MKESFNSSQLHYIPEEYGGDEFFEGIPIPTKEAFDYLGKEGVQYIQNRLAEMLSWRKIMFGQRHREIYGLLHIQRFVDLKNKICYEVGRSIIEKDASIINELVILDSDVSQKLHISNSLLAIQLDKHFDDMDKLKLTQDYITLQKIDHHLIEVAPLDIYPKDRDILEYFRFYYDPSTAIPEY
ncbi:MAG: hypothetical protein GKR88_15420 [Flavobacteriaceae bacterium]|nr:MAG: hypothetical protein GKR88_15420 [Flavobacteriaceae bacterium]